MSGHYYDGKQWSCKKIDKRIVNLDLELTKALTILGKERDDRGKWETEMFSKLNAAFHALRRLVDFVEVNLPDAYDDGHILTEAKDVLSQIRRSGC